MGLHTTQDQLGRVVAGRSPVFSRTASSTTHKRRTARFRAGVRAVDRSWKIASTLQLALVKQCQVSRKLPLLRLLRKNF